MSILITAGRLISTTDLSLAKKLQKIIKIEEITGGKTPEALKQYQNTIGFMFRGEYYEIERSQSV